MRLCSDRTGFPMLEVPEMRLAVHLLPVTKLQFESFLGSSKGFGDCQYESILSLNPRVSLREATSDNRERVLLSGALPEDALAFAYWLGPQYRLPSVREWRQLYRMLVADINLPEKRGLFWGSLPAEARAILDLVLASRSHPYTMADLFLFRAGLVEWVSEDGRFVGLGCPRAEFFPNLWDPLVEPVRPLRPDRKAYMGFRLVRPRANI